MSDDQRIDYHLLRIRHLVALIEHDNLLALREEGLGGWRSDHDEAVKDLNREIQEEQASLEGMLK